MNNEKNESEEIEDKTIIEKFDKIYSNHMNAKLTLKITKDEKPSTTISINEGEYLNINEKNIDYKDLTNYITRKSSSKINIDNKELDFDSQDDNKKYN